MTPHALWSITGLIIYAGIYAIGIGAVLAGVALAWEAAGRFW